VIRIAREPEPAGFAIIRDSKLQDARDAIAQGKRIQFKEYDYVKTDLARMQYNKCCYCEKLEEQAKYRDVEHYRPKSAYWWLTWTWENLLFACIDCNREHKRDQFPLSPGDKALVAELSPPGGEHPLVLDPSDPGIDPTTEITFRREFIHKRERWVPRGLTERGRTTIEVCGLDRPNLLDLYTDHVKHRVRPRLEPLFKADHEGHTRMVLETWNTAKRALLARARPFRALSYDALLVIVSPAYRDRYRLTLDRP
jgi:hypothetical protein